MKNLFLLLLLVIPGGAAEAALSWKVESERTIYFVPDFELSVSLNELRASEELWEQLDVSLSYNLAAAKAQAEELKRENPGYGVNRVLLGFHGNYRLRLPSLGVDEEVETLNGVEGPYFHWTRYLTKAEGRKVRAALADLPSFVRVEGSMKAVVPEERVVERASLPASICQELLREGEDVHAVVRAFPAVEERILSAAREEENRKVLREQVLRSCLEIKRSQRVSSFADLLSLKVKSTSGTGEFEATVKRMVRVERPVPVQYRLVRER